MLVPHGEKEHKVDMVRVNEEKGKQVKDLLGKGKISLWEPKFKFMWEDYEQSGFVKYWMY